MKKQELYKITIDGKEVFSSLNQTEYFNIMENLSIEYYQTGSPLPDTIISEIYLDENV